MKQMCKRILIVIGVLSLIFINKTEVNAKDNSTKYNANFIGEIIPVRNFYNGEYSKSNDFIIKGNFVDKNTNEIIPTDEWGLYDFSGINSNKVTLTLIHLPSFDDESVNKKCYNNIDISVDVMSKDFNSKVKLSNKKIINTTKDDLENKVLKLKFINSLGNNVCGDLVLKYNYDDLVLGINYINYTFNPASYHNAMVSHSGDQYNILEGTIKVNIIK